MVGRQDQREALAGLSRQGVGKESCWRHRELFHLWRHRELFHRGGGILVAKGRSPSGAAAKWRAPQSRSRPTKRKEVGLLPRRHTRANLTCTLSIIGDNRSPCRKRNRSSSEVGALLRGPACFSVEILSIIGDNRYGRPLHTRSLPTTVWFQQNPYHKNPTDFFRLWDRNQNPFERDLQYRSMFDNQDGSCRKKTSTTGLHDRSCDAKPPPRPRGQSFLQS